MIRNPEFCSGPQGRYSTLSSLQRGMLLQQAQKSLAEAAPNERPFVQADIVELQIKPLSAIRALLPAIESSDVRPRVAAFVYRGRLFCRSMRLRKRWRTMQRPQRSRVTTSYTR